MQFQFVKPSGFLKNFIKYYCFMETEAYEENVSERVIPVENLQLMFHYKQPFVVCHPNNSVSLQPRTIISGLNNSFSDVSTHGESGVIFVAFFPVGACHFFNFSLSEIENQSINLAEILGKEIRQIEEILYYKKTKDERIRVVEEFLLNRFSPIPAYDDSLIKAGVGLIKQQGGQITALTLAEKLSVTTKSLERKFSEYIGKTPKQYIKLIRLWQILSDFSNYKNINLTEYVYRNGYFDQSHFIRDFKIYTGYTPGEFLNQYPGCDIHEGSCN